MADDYRAALDEGRKTNEAALGMIGNQYTVDWSRYYTASPNDTTGAGVPETELEPPRGPH